MIFALLYKSDAITPMTDAELQTLIDTSVQKNAHKHITGLLVYKEQQFMQLIEGAEKDIRTLYKKIKQDQRHQNIELLFIGNIDSRNVNTWSCGFLNAEEGSINDEYVDFIYNIASNKFDGISELIQDYLLDFAIGN